MKHALLAPLLAVALLVPLSATAHATPEQDDALVDAMNLVGITLYSRAFGQARQVCSMVDVGFTPGEVADRVIDGNPSWAYGQAEMFVAASIGIYCPGQAPALAPQVELRKA